MLLYYLPGIITLTMKYFVIVTAFILIFALTFFGHAIFRIVMGKDLETFFTWNNVRFHLNITVTLFLLFLIVTLIRYFS